MARRHFNVLSIKFGPTRWKYCLAYIDDVLIFSQTFEDHATHLTDARAKPRTRDSMDFKSNRIFKDFSGFRYFFGFFQIVLDSRNFLDWCGISRINMDFSGLERIFEE